LEMLVVIIIIAALLILFVPKLTQQKDFAIKQTDKALVKLAKEQYEMYRLDNVNLPELTSNRLSDQQLNELLNNKYLSQEQVDKYRKLPADVFE